MYSSGLTAAWQLWHSPSSTATPGALHAIDQNCRVLGPRTIVERVTFPFSTIFLSVSYEQPGANGAFSSRICHGPIAFCVAWRDSGSKSPLHRAHWSVSGWIWPQYGQRMGLGPEAGSGPVRSAWAMFAADSAPPCFCSVGKFRSDAETGSAHPEYAGLTSGDASGLIDPVKDRSFAAWEGWGLALAACLMPAGCSPPKSQPVDRVVMRGLDSTDRYLSDRINTGESGGAPPIERPVASLDGEAITLEQLRPRLMEAGGGAVLEEIVLDRLLEREAANRGITITRRQVDAERSFLMESFAGAGLSRSDDEAARLILQIRRARGLGDSRFAALLRRNALLRALVAPDVTITPGLIEQAYLFRFGERYRARLIVVPSSAEATAVIERVNSGENFSAVAAEVSIDASAERGGVLEPISGADPSYPAGVRAALRTMQRGQVSAPIAVEQGFAILRLDEIIPAASPQPDRESVRPLLERDVRMQQERLLMNQLARRLIEGARLTILDRSLDEAWRMRTNRP